MPKGLRGHFLAEFVARADFQGTYGAMTNAQYVDALNTNTGGSLSTAERNALVSGLNNATETRATVLRKVAEDADFRARETSPAFYCSTSDICAAIRMSRPSRD